MVSEIPGLDKNNKDHKSALYVINNYSRAQLFYLILQSQEKNKHLDILKKENNKLQRQIIEAQEITRHWELLKQHLEKYPDLKEDWEGLCLAIKLTED